MKFVKKASCDEMITDIAENMFKLQNAEKFDAIQKQANGMALLAYAAGLLDETGYEKEAAVITNLLEKLSWHVPSTDAPTSGLTPEKMEKNLEEKGWVFNSDDVDHDEANDGEIVAVHDADEIKDKGTEETLKEQTEKTASADIDKQVLNAYWAKQKQEHEEELPRLNAMRAAAKLLMAHSPEEVLHKMMESGLSAEDAHWVVQAGHFINKDRKPIDSTLDEWFVD